MKLFRPIPAGSPIHGRLIRALFALVAVELFLLAIASLFRAPEWAKSAIVLGFPVEWFTAFVVIKVRG